MVFVIAQVFDNAVVFGNARVLGYGDYCCFQSFGSEGRTTTVFREADGGLRVSCGCFCGTPEEFAARVEMTHGDNRYGREYRAIMEVIRVKFNPHVENGSIISDK